MDYLLKFCVKPVSFPSMQQLYFCHLKDPNRIILTGCLPCSLEPISPLEGVYLNPLNHPLDWACILHIDIPNPRVFKMVMSGLGQPQMTVITTTTTNPGYPQQPGQVQYVYQQPQYPPQQAPPAGQPTYAMQQGTGQCHSGWVLCMDC